MQRAPANRLTGPRLWVLRTDARAASRLVGERAGLLSTLERSHAARFRREDDRLLHETGRIGLRLLLSRVEDVPPDAWVFESDDKGKPHISGPPSPVQFSLSHTRGLVAWALSPLGAIGVDAESVERPIDHVKIARRFFSPAENAWLTGSGPAERPEVFFTIWTLKEALLKAIGIGIGIDLRQVSFEVAERRVGATSEAAGIDLARWRFAVFRPTPPHVVAVCATRDDESLLPIVCADFTAAYDPEAPRLLPIAAGP